MAWQMSSESNLWLLQQLTGPVWATVAAADNSKVAWQTQRDAAYGTTAFVADSTTDFALRMIRVHAEVCACSECMQRMFRQQLHLHSLGKG
jgi:hypothetical protein